MRPHFWATAPAGCSQTVSSTAQAAAKRACRAFTFAGRLRLDDRRVMSDATMPCSAASCLSDVQQDIVFLTSRTKVDIQFHLQANQVATHQTSTDLCRSVYLFAAVQLIYWVAVTALTTLTCAGRADEQRAAATPASPRSRAPRR